MKKWSVLLAAVLLLAVGFVPTAQAAIEVEGDVYVGIWDKYLWRGFNLSESRPTIQGGIDLTAGGWTLSTWHNWQLKSGPTLDSGEMNETDIILSYAMNLGDMATLTIGNIWYSLDFTPGDKDTNEVFAHLTLNTLLSPTIKAWWDWDEADEDGLFFTFDISHSFDLSRWLGNTTLNLGALVSYNMHSDYAVGDYAGFHNYELSASFDFKMTEQLTLSPIFIFSSGISSAAKDAIDTQTVGALNLTFNF
ncbi:TorF family putative porin [Desulfuromonas sp. CSMB_57]|jgi:uncharacterized protein (TIGR02001 family)|uniref:TorF family putative porin n=1 Tax=Desulfuromonas sp. CSMB_57 TaxID=2807629 RepID=UPI001CD5BC37|nr:TorF family putative porin [Desulfuromonas sp. CSMB_57]